MDGFHYAFYYRLRHDQELFLTPNGIGGCSPLALAAGLI
jgi:hypothetical protein